MRNHCAKPTKHWLEKIHQKPNFSSLFYNTRNCVNTMRMWWKEERKKITTNTKTKIWHEYNEREWKKNMINPSTVAECKTFESMGEPFVVIKNGFESVMFSSHFLHIFSQKSNSKRSHGWFLFACNARLKWYCGIDFFSSTWYAISYVLP